MDSLPDELLDQIIAEAGGNNSTVPPQSTNIATLLNTCLVSRRFYRIAEPHLYSRIKIDLSVTYCDSTPPWSLDNFSTSRLMRRLNTWEALAKQVKAITATNSLARGGVYRRDLGHEGGVLYDFLKMLPNVKILNIWNYATPVQIDFGKAHQRFLNLSYLAIDIGSSHLYSLLPLFKLPKLTSLHLRHGRLAQVTDATVEALEEWMDFENNSIKHLSFTFLYIAYYEMRHQHTGLEDIGRACTSLASLRLKGFESYSSSWVMSCFKPSIERSIRQLEFRSASGTRYEDCVSTLSLHAPPDASALEEVKIELWLFMLSNTSQVPPTVEVTLRMPPSIKKLHLRTMHLCKWEKYASVMRQGLLRFRNEAPLKYKRLKEVLLEMERPYLDDKERHDEFVQNCREEFADIGVSFQVLILANRTRYSHEIVDEICAPY